MIGELVEGLERFGRFVGFCLATAVAMPGALARRPGEVLRQFDRVAWGSLPIAAAAGTSVGLVVRDRQPLTPLASAAFALAQSQQLRAMLDTLQAFRR